MVLGTLGSFSAGAGGAAGVAATFALAFRFSPEVEEEGTVVVLDEEAWLDEPLSEEEEAGGLEDDDLDDGFDDEYRLWWLLLDLYDLARGIAVAAREETTGEDCGATPTTRRTEEGIMFFVLSLSVGCQLVVAGSRGDR